MWTKLAWACLTTLVRHSWVDLQIADDGVGLAPTDHEKPHSMGLRGMAERVAALDGVLEFVSIPQGGTDGGTTIKVKLPIKAG